MTSFITLALPEPPSANRWHRKFHNRMVLSPEARAYKERVWLETSQFRSIADGPGYGALLPVEPIAVTMTWTRSRRAGDLDKRVGIVLDAIQQSVYADDSQIVELHAYRRDPDGKGGRMLIEVRPVLACPP